MEFRIIGNENPIGSRRFFEERINLHLRHGWQLHGSPVSGAVKAGDWQKNLGLHRPEMSLFVFQCVVHPVGDPRVRLQGLCDTYRWLADKPEAEHSPADLARLLDLHACLQMELDYHAELFPEKEAQEEGGGLRVSKERLKKAAMAAPAPAPAAAFPAA